MNGRNRVIVVIIAVLLSGCLLGASGFWLWEKRAQNALNVNDGYAQHEYSTRLFDQLQITSEQETRLKEILEESRREINTCRTELQDKMDSIRAKTNEKISSILDENQKSMFESLINETESHRGGSHHGQDRKTTGH